MLSACAINKVILMGRLTADPELRQTSNGINTCRFTVAVDGTTNPTTNERRTDFITVTAWRQTAEFVCRYFSKGRLILVEGNLRTSSYDDKNHPDVKHYTYEVTAESVSFGETKASSQGGGTYAPPQQYGQSGQNSQYRQSQYAPQQPQYAPPQSQYAPPQQNNNPAASVSVGDLGDFEEVIGDGDLPF